MRIALLSTATRTYVPNYIVPTGIMSIAAYLREQGHEVHIVDAAALGETHEKIARRVAALSPDVIGVGGIITAYAYIIALTSELRKLMPKTPLVLGGQVAINTVDLCFQHMGVDYIIHGYGEIAMAKLVRHLEGKLDITQIPGISYRRDGAIVENPGREFFKDINKLPLPAYDMVDMEHYATVNGHRFEKLHRYLAKSGKTVKNHRFATVMGTLGCTDRCTFCVHEQEYVGLKVFSNEYLINHMEFLNKKYDIHVFGIGEEMFLTTLKRAREFNQLMKERLPNVYWSASTRGNHVTKEMVEELETGNCFYIAWGYETGSQKMLDMMKKRMTREANLAAYKNIEDSDIVAAATLMVGNVGETYETVKDNITSIHETGINSPSVFFASPYPGGRTYDWAIERGIIKDRHAYLLKASNKDAAASINCNLTPYPDWILKAWQNMLLWATLKENFKKKYPLYADKSFKFRLKYALKIFLGFKLIPAPLVRFLVDGYFLYYNLTRKFYKTAKDRQFEYKTDPDGALAVDNLIVGDHQRYVAPEKFVKLVEKARAAQAAAQKQRATGGPTRSSWKFSLPIRSA